MGESRSRPWAVAALAVLVVLLAIDLATGPDVVVIALYGIAPLLASLGAGWRSTAAIGALALLAAAISRIFTHDMDAGQRRRCSCSPSACSARSPPAAR